MSYTARVSGNGCQFLKYAEDRMENERREGKWEKETFEINF
jgi:hypothetical protein